jgi:CBS domain-containing protein
MLHARDVMHAAPLVTATPEMTLAELERRLLEHHVSGVPVLSAGRIVGVVARSDIVKQISVARALAELIEDPDRAASGIAAPEVDDSALDARAGLIVAERIAKLTVGDVMTDAVVSVEPSTRIVEVAARMVEHGIHRVLVVEDGELRGIISSLDLAALFLDGRVKVSWSAKS